MGPTHRPAWAVEAQGIPPGLQGIQRRPPLGKPAGPPCRAAAASSSRQQAEQQQQASRPASSQPASSRVQHSSARLSRVWCGPQSAHAMPCHSISPPSTYGTRAQGALDTGQRKFSVSGKLCRESTDFCRQSTENIKPTFRFKACTIRKHMV